jgi:amino acid transporter
MTAHYTDAVRDYDRAKRQTTNSRDTSDTSLHISTNAIALTCVVTCLLALINIGSAVAFNAIISLQLVALIFSYTISITCALYRCIAHPELLPKTPWSLGEWGVPLNGLAVSYSTFAFFGSSSPGRTTVDASAMTWGVVMVWERGLCLCAFLFPAGEEDLSWTLSRRS